MRARRDLIAPVVGFLAATAVGFACAWIAGYDPLHWDNWSRWDSFHYISIAAHGYVDTTTSCPGSTAACEHAGWLGGYSAVLAVPFKLGLPGAATAVVVSWAFCLATFLVLWLRFPLPEDGRARLAVLVFVAFVPGFIYMHTVFPLSLLTLLALIALLLLERGRWLAGSLVGAAAAATYPLGILLAPVAALWLLIERKGLLRAVLAAAIVAAGFGAVLLAQGLWNGDYLGYFHAQHHALRDPVSGVWHEIRDSTSAERGRLETARAVQVLLTTAIAAVVAFVLVRRRGSLARLDVLAGFFALAVWALPLSQEGLSLYRSNAALLVAAPLLRHVGPVVRWGIAAASFVVAIPMAVLFFQGRLV
jgi:hypothetical protein